MINAVIGQVKTEIVLLFDLKVDGPNGGSSKNLKQTDKGCILKDSKALEKGSYIPFSESDNPENTDFIVEYQDMTTHINVLFSYMKTNPKLKIYTKLPTPERYVVSELFVEGNFEIKRIDVLSSKKKIDGAEFLAKLEKDKKLSLDHKLFFEVIGPPLVKQDIIQSELGEIKMVRPKLSVDI